MKKIIKGRWIIFILWLVVTIVLTVIQPDINAILRDRKQKVLPDNSPSVIGENLMSGMTDSDGSSDIIVFYDKDKISKKEMNQINNAVNKISDNKKELGVSQIIDPFHTPDAKSSLISKDKTTLMISFKLDKGTRKVNDIIKQFDRKLKNVSTEHYLSGEDFINNDYQEKAETGIEKSAGLTVIFILIVLIIMFRSVITPLVSLASVVFAYLCSMGIAAQLIDKANFPVTSLTQMLMILILFGIGTDYNILLFNRFKEELSHGYSIDDAILHTYKTAGKTIAFSILTIFIAFLSLIFAESPTYQSGIVIVIGTIVLLLEILTLTPFAMKLLGNKLFWPSKAANGHKENKLWGAVSNAATKHPIISVIAILLIIGPTIIFNQQKLNFDTIGELGNSCPSTKAFNIVSEHFGKGQAMPSTIIIKNDKALDNNSSLTIIDGLTEKIRKIKGVKKVSSVTQPEGKQIKNFYISSQTKSVTNGLGSMKDGIDKLYDGFSTAGDKLGSADFSKVNKMVDGTAKLQNGVNALSDGLKQIQAGIDDSQNPQTIRKGLSTIESNLNKMSSGVKLLADNYTSMQAGYSKMGSSYQQTTKALLGLKGALSSMQITVNSLGDSYSGSKSDANYITLKATIDQLVISLKDITPEGIKLLNDNYNKATAGFAKANDGLTKMSSGLSQLAAGLNKINSGLGKASSGIGTIATNMDKVSEGLAQMKTGQQKLVTGLNGFSTFGKQLTDVNNGLKKISDGLGQTNDFLLQLTTNKTFYMPKEALTSKDVQKVFKMYMSKDRTSTMLTVILDADPYSEAATDTIDKISTIVSDGLNGTALSSAKYGVSGPSSTTNDMNDMLSRDLNRTSIIVIIGVFLILVVVIRSFWEPLFITGALMGAFYAAMFIINRMFVDVMGYEGISSFVPFFSFIIIVALGVDYSIFLMARYKEYPELSAKEAIVVASKNIGSVVMSACLILGGTFGTLMPSGLVLLCEMATAVITGLLVLCFLMLPVFLPAMISLREWIYNLTRKEKQSHKEEVNRVMLDDYDNCNV